MVLTSLPFEAGELSKPAGPGAAGIGGRSSRFPGAACAGRS